MESDGHMTVDPSTLAASIETVVAEAEASAAATERAEALAERALGAGDGTVGPAREALTAAMGRGPVHAVRTTAAEGMGYGSRHFSLERDWEREVTTYRTPQEPASPDEKAPPGLPAHLRPTFGMRL